MRIRHFKYQFLKTMLVLCTLGWSVAYAQEALKVRSGDHPSYSRIVFDWNRNVNYSANLTGNMLEINFLADAIPDFSAVLNASPNYVSNPVYSDDGGLLTVTFDVAEGGQLRHFRSGTKVVIDVYVDGARMPARQANAVQGDADSVIGNAQDEISDQTQETRPAAVAPTPALASRPVAGAQIASNVTVNGREANDAFIIDYEWDHDVKAAAFIRGGHLWVVFDQYTAVDQTSLNNVLGGRVKSAEQLVDQSPTILHYAIAADQNARMEKMTNGWQVSLRSNAAVPQLPIEVGHQTISNVGENIFLMANDLGNVINIEDPYIGDSISIVPASLSSQGVMEQNNYTEFNILKSAQGIAVQLIADDIFVTRHETGVSISGQDGLAVSRSSVPALSEPLPVTADGKPADEIRMLLDFESWETGPLPDKGYTENRHELLYRLSTSTQEDRNEARWNLATFNLANNNAAEAYGILQVMGESEPGFIENPSYRATLAVANIKLRRFEEAIELLSHRSLVAELDAILWRSLAYEAIGEYQKAMDDFNLGVDVLALQPVDERAAFLFSSLRAGSALGDIENMNNRINSMSSLALDAKQLSELDYWRGRMAEQYGDEALAAEEYDKVIAAGVRYPAALAKVARINQQHRLEEIDAPEAIDQLEKLRFAWRGDDFELDLLKQLGQLYVEQQDYREGLSTLRQAATYFPGSPKTSGLTREMSEIYNDLFLNGGADNMSPLKAMALFLEFRELTPLGAAGDTMTRNLARRMVSVDLLNDAADLLEFQVENRLQGVARADIASDLARIYVMNKEPDKAVQILRATRQSQVPEDIEFERRMIEIRALVQLGQYEEAEVMLEGISSEEAENLRSDIFWKTENWQAVVDHGYQRLDRRWTDSAELTDGERQSVLRIAVALALDEDEIGLESLRSQYGVHMEDGLFADAFELITAKEIKSGDDIRELTQTIASVDQLETFMDSYRSEFAVNAN